MRAASLLLFALGSSAISEWCVGPPAKPSHTPSPPVNGSEFRGAFRDLALWLEPEGKALAAGKDHHCRAFKRHTKGNDGLWVIEFDHTLDLYKEEKAAARAGISVLLKQGKTLVLGGGEKVPDLLGYDACGFEPNKRVISVPTRDVRGPRPMSAWTKTTYMRKAKNKRSDIANIVDQIVPDKLSGLITHMQEYNSRNSFSGSNDLEAAANWVEERLRSFGATVTRHKFQDDMVAQVIATIPGVKDPSKIIVAGAHYDSRGTERNSPTQRAPGADDNGSGSAAVVELARLIFENKIQLAHTLKLMLFTGEEQGLVGSRAIASEMAANGDNVIAMFNADMIGYSDPEAGIILGFMDRYADLDLTDIAIQTTNTYVPSLRIAYTQACCSDQQSFYENGFPSVAFFETPTQAVIYPQYHKSDDLLKYLNLEQIQLEAQSLAASVLLFADPQ